VVFESESRLLDVIARLRSNDIMPRRYFYPSLDTLQYLNDAKRCDVSRDIAKRIICLPVYPGLSTSQQQSIINLIEK
jgi:dTDP-4-amino-4,6-dideoxygalactose transaminase